MGAFYLCFPIPPRVSAPEAPGQSNTETRSFSELTLFLFGSGLALFVALLGWSDQIRGIDKDTRELENTFLTATGVDKRQFMSVIKASTPQAELKALTVVMCSGKLRNPNYVQLLDIFKTWHEDWTHLQHVSSHKYNLTIALTIAFLLSGILSLHTDANRYIDFAGLLIREELLVLFCPVLLMGVLMGIIIYSSTKETALKDLLMKISDMV